MYILGHLWIKCKQFLQSLDIFTIFSNIIFTQHLKFIYAYSSAASAEFPCMCGYSQLYLRSSWAVTKREKMTATFVCSSFMNIFRSKFLPFQTILNTILIISLGVLQFNNLYSRIRFCKFKTLLLSHIATPFQYSENVIIIYLILLCWLINRFKNNI